LSERVERFHVTFLSPDRFLVELTLGDDDGLTVALREVVCARNVLQNGGKRVR
jgi:hypothetical protein